MSVLTAIKLEKIASGLRALQMQCSNSACRLRTISHDIWGRRTGSDLDGSWYCSPECLKGALRDRLWQLSMANEAHPLPRMPLGLVLLSKGFLQEEQLRVLNERQGAEGRDFVFIVRESGLVTDEQLTTAIAAQWGQPVLISSSKRFVPPGVVPASLVREYGVLPIHMVASTRKIVVGFVNRVDYSALRAIEQLHQCETVPCFITNKIFESALCSMEEQNESALRCDESGTAATTQRLVGEIRNNEVENTWIVRFGEHIWARMFARRRRFDLIFSL